MQAVINASDEGTRLRPLSCGKNPFLLKVGQESILSGMLSLLKKHGVTEVVIITDYLGREIRERFGTSDGEISIKYVKGMYNDGALKLHSDILKDEFFYFSLPVYTDINLTKLKDYHSRKGAYATCVTGAGVTRGLINGEGNRIWGVSEARLWDRLSKNKGVGIYLLKRDIVRFMPEETTVDIGEGLLPVILRSGKSIHTYNDPDTVVLHDVSSYIRMNNMLLQKNPDKIVVMEGAVVEKGALLEKPCFIGRGAHIRKGARIGSGSIIGERVYVDEKARIKRSIVMDMCRVEKGVSLCGCVVDEKVRIGEGTSIFEEAIVGFGSKLGKNVTIKSFVKIWPEKEIDNNITLSENLMWGQKKRGRISEKGEIKGILNVDITPSFATRVGECVGFIFPLSEIGVSTDASPGAQMLKEGVVSGLMSQGIKVRDFGEQPLPITRRAVMFYMLCGAVAITTFEKNGEEWAEFTIVAKDGTDISQGLLERMDSIYERGDFSYPEAKNIKEPQYHFEYKLYYLKSLMTTPIKKKTNIKILLCSPAAWGRRLVLSAMADYGISVCVYREEHGENLERQFEAAVEEGKFEIGFLTDEKCEKLKIALPGWGIIDEYVYEVLYSLIIMIKYKNAEIVVPKEASTAIDNLARSYGGNVVRAYGGKGEIMQKLSGNEDYLTEQFIYRYDAIGAVIKLLEFVATRGISIEMLLEKIPKISMAKVEIEISPEEMDTVLGKIIKEGKTEKGDNEAVKITFDKGWVMVIPDRIKESVSIVSEGVNTEAAKELCNFCVRKIKS